MVHKMCLIFKSSQASPTLMVTLSDTSHPCLLLTVQYTPGHYKMDALFVSSYTTPCKGTHPPFYTTGSCHLSWYLVLSVGT